MSQITGSGITANANFSQSLSIDDAPVVEFYGNLTTTGNSTFSTNISNLELYKAHKSEIDAAYEEFQSKVLTVNISI